MQRIDAVKLVGLVAACAGCAGQQRPAEPLAPAIPEEYVMHAVPASWVPQAVIAAEGFCAYPVPDGSLPALWAGDLAD